MFYVLCTCNNGKYMVIEILLQNNVAVGPNTFNVIKNMDN